MVNKLNNSSHYFPPPARMRENGKRMRGMRKAGKLRRRIFVNKITRAPVENRRPSWGRSLPAPLIHAARLLAKNAASVSAIAMKVGYKNQAHFCRSFKKQFGCPPSEYSKNKGVVLKQIIDKYHCFNPFIDVSYVA